MRFALIILLFSIQSCLVFAGTDSLLNKLDQTLIDRGKHDNLKQTRIEVLKSSLGQVSLADRYFVLAHIYEEYKSYNYDSAFKYARYMQREAYKKNDPVQIATAKVKLSFTLLSSGMFNEALDTLHTIKLPLLRDSVKIQFYSVLARTYYDLVDFNRDDYFTQRYTELGNQYVDSAMMLCDKKSSLYYSLRAMKYLRQEDLQAARKDLEYQMTNFKLSDPELAIAASTLAYICQRQKDFELAKMYLAKASLADTRSSTKETLALLNLAELLYKDGDVQRAYNYVKLAMEDANFYGARHRKIQVAAIFPIIEGNKLDTVEHQRKLLVAYAIVITVLSLMTIGFAVIIYKQFRKIKEADKRIQAANTNLQDANTMLREVNNHLLEANKIKEEYIGYYFKINSEYLEKIEAFKRAIDNKLMTKKFEDIRLVVNNINLKKEREELYISFDKVFLKLFPDFVSTFNSFFNEEDRIILKDGQLLNTELRIFALIRMGIGDTEKIAKILDYSINTIYNYKARIKSKSLIPNEEFEKKIMEIEAI